MKRSDKKLALEYEAAEKQWRQSQIVTNELQHKMNKIRNKIMAPGMLEVVGNFYKVRIRGYGSSMYQKHVYVFVSEADPEAGTVTMHQVVFWGSASKAEENVVVQYKDWKTRLVKRNITTMQNYDGTLKSAMKCIHKRMKVTKNDVRYAKTDV